MLAAHWLASIMLNLMLCLWNAVSLMSRPDRMSTDIGGVLIQITFKKSGLARIVEYIKDGPFPGNSVTLSSGPTHHHHLTIKTFLCFELEQI